MPETLGIIELAAVEVFEHSQQPNHQPNGDRLKALYQSVLFAFQTLTALI